MLIIVFLCSLSVFAQNSRVITGTVVDEQNNPIVGATVVIKSTTTGTVTDINGVFSLKVPTIGNQVIVISFIGMEPMEIDVTNKTNVSVVLNMQNNVLNETIVVGFGQQKKESVVGAITQTTGKVLERAGGVSSVGAALTGNVPGVITSSSTGMPGEEDPKIVIRAASTWNGSDPLVLVEGIERPMNSVDISSVESISVLKDASATSIFD